MVEAGAETAEEGAFGAVQVERRQVGRDRRSREGDLPGADPAWTAGRAAPAGHAIGAAVDDEGASAEITQPDSSVGAGSPAADDADIRVR